jgi:pimeloyl-ACP methyl ester carboxylesterase
MSPLNASQSFFRLIDIMLRHTVTTIVCILLIVSIITGVFIPNENQCTKDSRPNHREYFYVGGEYIFDATSKGFVMTGQIYVEHLTSPYGVQQPYPLVLIHGNAMTGTNWLNTPDGRPGWASYFLEQGYEIYIVDQPARGRSIWLPTSGIAVKTYSAEMMEERFTATNVYKLWPQAVLHTQWPGNNSTTKGRKGDPIFDAFYASTVQFVASEINVQTMIQKAGTALLDKIGAAILLTHSQSGSFGWLIADARPNLVKAIVAIEPKGPPFREAVFTNTSYRPWGVTDIPLTYDPAINSSSELLTIEIPSSNENHTSCILQQEPARTLIHLVNISVLIETAQASYHAAYDHCTVDFLRQAGVQVDFIRLEDLGIYGNGHMQMMEKNNLQIAEVLHKWIIKNVH